MLIDPLLTRLLQEHADVRLARDRTSRQDWVPFARSAESARDAEAIARRCSDVMAVMLPEAFPHDIAKKPKLRGEALVFEALAVALDDDWTVFYDRSISGSRRRVDFIAANSRRGLLVIEVKGGLVHDKRGSFRQLISTIGQRKKIDPFGQLKLALRDLLASASVNSDEVPMHQAIWFPEMGQAGLRWEASDHILTRDILVSSRLIDVIDRVLPHGAVEDRKATIDRIVARLT